MSNWRTPGGSPTAEAREKYAVLSGGRFPIWDKESALSAIRLRGRGTTKQERMTILRAAAKYAPAEAKEAMKEDMTT